MKAILLITLLAIASCETPVEIVKCFLESDIIFKGVAKLIEAIQSQQISEIVSVVIALYGPFVEEVKKCLGMTNDEIALQFPEWIKKLLPILGEIVKTIWKNGGCQAVKDFCKSKAGDICNLIPC